MVCRQKQSVPHRRKVVTEVITAIKNHFGAISTTRGNKHSFLGMNIAFNKNNRTVALEMKDQIQESIEMFREVSTEPVSSPATRTLCDIDPIQKNSMLKIQQNFIHLRKNHYFEQNAKG